MIRTDNIKHIHGHPRSETAPHHNQLGPELQDYMTQLGDWVKRVVCCYVLRGHCELDKSHRLSISNTEPVLFLLDRPTSLFSLLLPCALSPFTVMKVILGCS